ncbi:hypothetical protein G3I40_12210 [Streptomyces sp. SID14478]|uniref:hypothetical protein n=1 Tax=Streptomyces sp. SID14478 TaxID=2706073 RepID=UPI0013DC6B68|nr:hypothetical protein [Streptomyces sp. SID14478]NEB75978.1 hypothetical protein [Streptomyces sp. SID14478]
MDREWITGECWLWCERTGVPVVWLGPVQWGGQHAPLYSCAPCLRRLETKAAHYLLTRKSSHI